MPTTDELRKAADLSAKRDKIDAELADLSRERDTLSAQIDKLTGAATPTLGRPRRQGQNPTPAKQEDVLAALKKRGPANAARVADAIGSNTRAVELALSKLHEAGKVEASGRGRYRDYKVL